MWRVLALALGSGVNTAIFSVIDAVLLRPLPFPHADRLVQINEQDSGGRHISLSYPNFLAMRTRNRSFSTIAGYRNRGMNSTGLEAAVRVKVAEVNWEFFVLLGTRPVLGRIFTAEDDRVDAEPAILISSGLWTRKFRRRANVLGQDIALNGWKYKIAGVMPALPEPFQTAEVFIPLTLFAREGDGMLDRGNHTGLFAIGLRKSGISQEQAEADLRDISENLERQDPLVDSGIRGVAALFLDSMVSKVRPGLWMLFAAVGLVLLIACANVANLMLARSSARRREVAVRAALGAGRLAIVRQFLAESLVLSAAGATLGTLAAFWVVGVVIRYGPGNIARLAETRLNPAVLGFTIGLTVISAILFGLAPAIGAARTDVMDAMRSGGRTVTKLHGRDRMRSALLVAEVALAMVLLAGAGLMLRTIDRITRVDPGFDPHGVMAVTVNPRYSDAEVKMFWERALDRVRAIPGVQSASATLNPPFEESQWNSVFLASNAPPADRAHLPTSQFTAVASRYFETMGIRVVRRRPFTESDGKQKPWVVIVNETLAHQIWGARDPIGQRLKQGFPEMKMEWCEVIGVVADAKQDSLDAPTRMETYLPLTQDAEDYMSILVRAGTNPLRLGPAVEREIRAMDATVPVFDVPDAGPGAGGVVCAATVFNRVTRGIRVNCPAAGGRRNLWRHQLHGGAGQTGNRGAYGAGGAQDGCFRNGIEAGTDAVAVWTRDRRRRVDRHRASDEVDAVRRQRDRSVDAERGGNDPFRVGSGGVYRTCLARRPSGSGGRPARGVTITSPAGPSTTTAP